MGLITLPGNPELEIILRRSARARRLSLRVSALDGRATLTLPRHVSEAEGRAFVQEKESWLRKHVDARGQTIDIHPGALLPIEGVAREVRTGQGRSVVLTDGAVFVPGPEARLPARLKGWLKARARDRLAEASDRYAQKLGCPYNRLTIRDTRSRWGSCTADGGLMYSWRLILTAPDVLNYVAAHEVAHLREMNHSQAFWDLVTELYGDWHEPRRWLRREGAGLHAYRFGD